MEVLIVGDRIRLARKLRRVNQVMRIVSNVIDRNDTAKRANDGMAEEVLQIAEELYPERLEREEQSRAWNSNNTYVKYHVGDQFAILHELDSNDILSLSFIKYNQAEELVQVVMPEYVSRKITTKHAWYLLVDHLAMKQKLTAERLNPNV